MKKIISAKQFITLVSLVTICFTGACIRSEETPNAPLQAIQSDESTSPVVILGGGVGGLTAALYCLQAQVPTIVIEGSKPGGALAQSHSVRNWPGVSNAAGVDITRNIKQQVIEAGASVVQERVVSVDFAQRPFLITTAAIDDPAVTRTIKATSVIIATGTEPNLLGIPGEQLFWGRGVSNCAVCEGSLFKGKTVAIVGGGDAAIVEASYLAAIAQKVVIVVRGSAFRAKDTIARDAVLAKSNVEVRYNTTMQQINGDENGVTNAILLNKNTNQQTALQTDGVFLAIGSKPNTKFLAGQVLLDERGFVVLRKHQQSMVPGVFAVGDVCDSEFVQAITAAGDGCKAALQAIKYLTVLRDVAHHGLKIAQNIIEGKVAAPVKKEVVKADGDVYEIVSMNDVDQRIMNSGQPVVLDIFATWCGPCQRMAPIFDRLAKKYAGRVSFLKLNIENDRCDLDAIIKRLQGKSVMSVPAFLFIKNGKEQARIPGSTSEQQFENVINTTFGL